MVKSMINTYLNIQREVQFVNSRRVHLIKFLFVLISLYYVFRCLYASSNKNKYAKYFEISILKITRYTHFSYTHTSRITFQGLLLKISFTVYIYEKSELSILLNLHEKEFFFYKMLD